MLFFKTSRTYQLKNPLPVRFPDGIRGAEANAAALQEYRELDEGASRAADDEVSGNAELYARARLRRPELPACRFGRSLVDDEDLGDETEARVEELP